MTTIENWLSAFTSAWQSHDIDTVLDLFADNVEYWETPFQKLTGKGAIKAEWQTILTQKDIILSTTVFSKDENRYAVQWELRYTNEQDTPKHWEGVYLITLDSHNRCTFFFHCGEARK
jgi:ketosteroid isomerase-like protein